MKGVQQMKFLARLIFMLAILGLFGIIIYFVGMAALQNAKESAKTIGMDFGPTAALGLLIISIILLAVGGDGGKK